MKAIQWTTKWKMNEQRATDRDIFGYEGLPYPSLTCKSSVRNASLGASDLS